MLLHRFKKIAFIFGVMIVLVIALSLPAFAQDIEFELPSNYYDLIVNDNVHQSYDYFYIDTDGHYHYAIVSLSFGDFSHPDSGTWAGRSVSPFICSNVTTPATNLYVLPCINSTNLDSGYVYVYYKQIVYNTDGSVASGDTTTWRYTGGRYFQNTNFWFSKLNLNFTSAHLSLLDENSIVLLNHPSSDYSASVTPISYEPSTYSIVSGFNDYTTSIEDDIYINGTLMFSPSRSDIFELHGYGSIFPVTDGSGNIVSYDFNITQDYSPILNYQPDGSTVPDLDIDDPNDDMFPEASFDSDDLDDLGIMSGGTALTWFYARFNDLVTGGNNATSANVKILALVTSCLSLGFITLILNKRSI